MGYHGKYWSCTKFADWLRGTPKPGAETGKGWNQWNKASKEAHPVRYWLAEEGLDKVQDFIFWPATALDKISYYINNRWVTKSHALTAHPRDIKPGDWCDVGNRFLPCLFNELVDFVEIESAWMNVVWNDEAREKYKTPWWRTGIFRLRAWRCPEAGLDHLRWASELTNKDFIEEGEIPELSRQALDAREILELYTWFTEVYRNRPDPHEAGGWSAYCDKRTKAGISIFDLEDRDEADRAESAAALDKTHEIEKAYEDEDEEMMIRLIKVRGSLWT